jgi:single-stranded-DNA-specific exonuclease
MYAEGHANALGVGVKDVNFSKLIDKADSDLRDYDFTPCYKVDIIYQGSDFNGKDIVDLAELKAVWGQGVEEPLVAIENIKVTKANVQLMSADKNPTLKITLPNGTSLIKFRSSNEEYEKLCSELGCVTINVVGKCERNVWNGSITPQIIIEDYEIVGSTQYYF